MSDECDDTMAVMSSTPVFHHDRFCSITPSLLCISTPPTARQTSLKPSALSLFLVLSILLIQEPQGLLSCTDCNTLNAPTCEIEPECDSVQGFVEYLLRRL